MLKHFLHQKDFRFKKNKKKRAQNGLETLSKSQDPQLGQWLPSLYLNIWLFTKRPQRYGLASIFHKLYNYFREYYDLIYLASY
jgi:hypothetical protein